VPPVVYERHEVGHQSARGGRAFPVGASRQPGLQVVAATTGLLAHGRNGWDFPHEDDAAFPTPAAQEDHGFAVVELSLIILGKSAVKFQPCKKSFNDPAFGQDFCSLLKRTASSQFLKFPLPSFWDQRHFMAD